MKPSKRASYLRKAASFAKVLGDQDEGFRKVLQREQENFRQTIETLIQNDETNRDRFSHLLKLSTGGDGFCFVHMATLPDLSTLKAVLFPRGELTLFDINAEIVDIDAFDYPTLVETGAVTNRHSVGPIPTLHQRDFRDLGRFQLPLHASNKRFNVFINARNGTFTEILRLKLVKLPDGRPCWSEAFAVSARFYDGKEGMVIKHIDPSFPQDTLKEDSDWKQLPELPTLVVKGGEF